METVNTYSENSAIQQNDKKRKIRNRLIIVSCLLIIFLFLYLMAFRSKVKNIKITGNNILSDDYIEQLVSIEPDSRYFLISTVLKEAAALKSPYIKDISISTGKYNTINIEVTENRIVGYIVDEDASYFLLEDGSRQPFDASVIKSLSLLPLFVDVDSDVAEEIAPELAKLDLDVFWRISEVSVTSFTYETNMIKLTMDDGYYIYSSLSGLPYINQYFDIVCNNKEQASHCILIVEEYSSAAVIDCKDIANYQTTLESN